MEFARIVVKKDYEKRGDLVLRSYIRALNIIDETRLIDGDVAYIYGVIDDNKKFHELFTNEVIDFDNYELVGIEEIFEIDTMPSKRKEYLAKIMRNILFGEKIILDFEVSTMEELSEDRAVEFEAYNNYLSGINPYQRLLSSDDQSKYNAYNSLVCKIKAIKEMKRLDKTDSFDQYEQAVYESGRGAYVRK